MPVHYKNTLYNCRVICLNQQILLIRPKLFLADGNNYREARWFTPWLKDKGRAVEDFHLSTEIQKITGQKITKFGNAVIQCIDTSIACETCEELWVPKNPHVNYGLDGVEIVANGSGSHHELRKLNTRLQLIQSATARNGGVYMYANLKGCDGTRLYFDGSSIIAMNGRIYS
jgi:NAD+ synthase (glutamine-hydrolysing)